MARRLDELIEVARRVPGPIGQPRAIDDDEIARRLALAAAEVEAMRAMTYRSLSVAARTGMPGAEASMIRLFFSELIQRIDALAMDILGPAGAWRASTRTARRRASGASAISPGSRRPSAAAPRRSSATSSASACSACRVEEPDAWT